MWVMDGRRVTHLEGPHHFQEGAKRLNPGCRVCSEHLPALELGHDTGVWSQEGGLAPQGIARWQEFWASCGTETKTVRDARSRIQYEEKG